MADDSGEDVDPNSVDVGDEESEADEMQAVYGAVPVIDGVENVSESEDDVTEYPRQVDEFEESYVDEVDDDDTLRSNATQAAVRLREDERLARDMSFNRVTQATRRRLG